MLIKTKNRTGFSVNKYGKFRYIQTANIPISINIRPYFVTSYKKHAAKHMFLVCPVCIYSTLGVYTDVPKNRNMPS